MGLFKSRNEKIKDEWEKIKKNWNVTSESKLGVSYEEALKLRKEFEKAFIDATNEQGLVSDFSVINALFHDLTPKQKVLILFYARWMDEANLKESPI